MRFLRRWWTRIRNFAMGGQDDERLREEMEQHIALQTEENLRAGMSAVEARRRAVLKFGAREAIREEYHAEQGLPFFENLKQDVRFALRMLRKSPGFTVVAILTVALGIGATAAIFSVVDATLLHPLPYAHPEQLVSIEDDLAGMGARDVGMSQPEWLDLERSGIFDYVSPVWFDENNLTGASRPARVPLLIVAPNYFSLLGVKPQMGHGFDLRNGGPGVIQDAVISDGLWKRDFGGDPHVLDKSMRLDTDLYRIIGVLPPGFQAPERAAEQRNTEVWVSTNFYGTPMSFQPPRARRNLPETIGRIKPGLTLKEAQDKLDALAASLRKQYPDAYPAESQWTLRLTPLKERVVGNVRQSLTMLLGAVGLVLLIGCVNVANLMLARASARGREMAVRQALGAGRKRLVRQVLTESLLLSLLGGVAGLAVLFCARGFLLRLIPESVPRSNDLPISWGVLLFALGASIVAGAIFGLAPALQASRLHLTHALKQEGRGSTGSGEQARTRRALVVTEFALSLILMIAASLLLHSFWDLLHARLGFDPQNVMAVRTRLPEPNNPAIDKYATAGQEVPFLREVLRREKTLPGVEEAAAGDSEAIPLDASERELNIIAEGSFFVQFEGRDLPSEQPAVVERSRVTPGYFHLLGIPLLRGRWFNDQDDAKAPLVAVINEAMGRTYWPGEDPLGKRFRSTRAGSPWVTVVGTIADARTKSLAEGDVPEIYEDLYQVGAKRLEIFVRGHLNTAAIPDEAREQVQSVDPTLPVFGAHTLNAVVSGSLAERRFSMEMVGLLALTALLLAGLGIYGVISWAVNERTHEIGIRLALGAQRGKIVGMVVRQGLGLAMAGAGVGLVGALIAARLMAGLLYGVTPTDPLTFAGVTLVLTVVAAAACCLPARRAMQVDPMVALRHE